MPLLLRDGRSIFFAHVPKTAGSSVQEYLVRRFGPLCMLEDFSKRRKRDIVQTVSHLSAADLKTLLPRDLDYCFSIVRDPVARITSEYRFQTGVSKASKLGFSNWLRVVLVAAAHDPRVYENHIRPQGDLVPEDAEVFHMEDGFDQMIARLDEVTGTAAPEIEMGHLLKRSRKPIMIYRQDIELITKFYASDYARFGYEQPSLENFENDPFHRLRALIGGVLGRLLVFKQRADWNS